MLPYQDYTNRFVLSTDASYGSIGEVLHQQHEGKEVVVAYANRTLSKVERKDCVTQKNY